MSDQDSSQPPSLLRLLSLATLAAVLWLGSLRLAAGSGPLEWNPYAIPTLGWYVLGALLVALALGTLSRPQAGLRWGLLITLALVPAALLLGLLLSFAATATYWWAALLVGLLLLGWVAHGRLRRVTGARQWPALVAALGLATGFAWLNEALYLQPMPWFASEPETTSAVAATDQAEALLFSQPGRIDVALDRLGPRELGPSAFFLGFAGYAEEKVFAEEIRFAARVMDARYGSGQRTLFLLNDVRDRASMPLASVAALRYALSGLAEQMNKDTDLLIMALSSHGAETAELAVSNGGLPLQQLTAADVGAALAEAGIRWRLLVISACYAGSFVETLADDYTAIITSAAPDRTSFGCSNDRDLTYFGEAFYRDALPAADSLRSAFETATTLVTERELQIDVPPSLPVAHFGSQIESKLAAMAATHRQRARSPHAREPAF